jgi:hypothetical protein
MTALRPGASPPPVSTPIRRTFLVSDILTSIARECERMINSGFRITDMHSAVESGPVLNGPF